MKESKVFSFFSGSGFLDFGFEKAGFEIVFVNEIFKPFLDAYKYTRNNKIPEFGYSDTCIESILESEDVIETLKSNLRKCKRNGFHTGFIGGPPCPDFSNAGKHKGFKGENGRLTNVYFDLITECEPDWFLFENVEGLFKTKKHREFFDKLMEKTKSKGYIINYDVVNALEFGVPQDRERVLFFGIKRTLARKDAIENPDTETLYKSYHEIKSLNTRAYAKFSLNEIRKTSWPSTRDFTGYAGLSSPEGIIEKLTVEHWFQNNQVESHPNSKHHFKPTVGNNRFFEIKEGCVSGKSYKRLHRWRYSPTAAYGNNEVHLHPYRARRISAAESLAIQSMPRSFALPEAMSLTNMFKTIGNGVPFLMANSVAKSIKNYLRFIQE
ncbi:DNA-methyltransferase [Teredinibacter turnerae T7901]|uniref:DNA (cytosine-5-)-methyltransferase n=1 Tax=Teredinibacter turnerae (strain ATCC 39867 / T7901) TaxID=377629 RepID=C5BUI4_TERTT|nr:DNA cytosine methyltransferase [Teredinibacter turnerae]ACR14362.1 DNA-methyltransferase [Teredinibacter turnerae T7901]